MRDTSPQGLAAVEKQQNASLAEQKAGYPKGGSNTYSDVQNVPPGPTEATIARNTTNSHSVPMSMTGSTADTGRKEP